MICMCSNLCLICTKSIWHHKCTWWCCIFRGTKKVIFIHWHKEWLFASQDCEGSAPWVCHIYVHVMDTVSLSYICTCHWNYESVIYIYMSLKLWVCHIHVHVIDTVSLSYICTCHGHCEFVIYMYMSLTLWVCHIYVHVIMFKKKNLISACVWEIIYVEYVCLDWIIGQLSKENKQ